ncbi:hypothetical protein [Prauserella muralis]|uniref:Uncharacterized protein n=1 Tax=Prauserella muralis TaxID=588067 RepID=A0A2V4ABS3_9PSEU|nr:hypothetical protein [Prauserella muralis]PXY16549.1 hypothetical protein BAY60_35705 [Prauserella muralis]TWE11213.1 hypothetical protein FHX69_7432 [Prauserella muralis]
MPIRPENRDRYGGDWPRFSAYIRFERAGGRCECRGECGRPPGHLAADGRCRNWHGQPAWGAAGTGEQIPLGDLAEPGVGELVVLTVAHRNHVPEQRGEDEVFAACQGCHLHYDIDHHRATRQRIRTAELAAQHYPLFDLGASPSAPPQPALSSDDTTTGRNGVTG